MTNTTAPEFQSLHTGLAVETDPDCRICFARPARAGKDGCCAICHKRLQWQAVLTGQVR